MKRAICEISDVEFNEAYANKDNRNIMQSIIRGYGKLFSADEIPGLEMASLMNTLRSHDTDFGQKFTTSLYKFTHWECRRELRRRRIQAKKGNVSIDSIGELSNEKYFLGTTPNRLDEEQTEDVSLIRERLKYLSKHQRKLVQEYYFDKYTMEEMGERHNCSKETIRNQMDRALGRLRELCEMCEEEQNLESVA